MQKVISRMDNSIQQDTDYYDTSYVVEDLGEVLGFSKKENGSYRIPPELLWIDDVLDEPIKDYPVLISKIWNEAVIRQLFVFYIVFQTYSKQFKSDS